MKKFDYMMLVLFVTGAIATLTVGCTTAAKIPPHRYDGRDYLRTH